MQSEQQSRESRGNRLAGKRAYQLVSQQGRQQMEQHRRQMPSGGIGPEQLVVGEQPDQKQRPVIWRRQIAGNRRQVGPDIGREVTRDFAPIADSRILDNLGVIVVDESER